MVLKINNKKVSRTTYKWDDTGFRFAKLRF